MSAPQIGLAQFIAASPEAVWAVITDISSATGTLSGVDSIELLTNGPYRVGTRG